MSLTKHLTTTGIHLDSTIMMWQINFWAGDNDNDYAGSSKWSVNPNFFFKQQVALQVFPVWKKSFL